MTSKLEYLQRYMSGSSGDRANDERKKKKKGTKAKSDESVTLVDVDPAWEQSAPSREEIEKKWEIDAAEDELPLVVAADDRELVDPQDLPVFVDADKYLDSIERQKFFHKKREDEDLSPPRKNAARHIESIQDDARSVAFPRRRRIDTTSKAASQDINKSALQPRRKEHTTRYEREEWSSRRFRRTDGAAPPMKSPKVDDASPPRKSRQDRSDSRGNTKRPLNLPTQSHAAPDRQHRVDSLGRDIPSHSSRRSKRSSLNSTEEKKDSERRTRGHSINHERRRAPGPRCLNIKTCQSRIRSPHSRMRDSRSRSPSVRRQYSLGSRPAKNSRGRISRSSSIRRRTSHCDKHKRSADDDDARRMSRAAAQSSVSENPIRTPRDCATQCNKDEIKEKPQKAKNGKEDRRAGLFTANEFESQREVAAKHKDILLGVDASELGANAETVYRDKRGRKLDMLNELVRQQEVQDGKRKREEREEYEWGTGTVQKKERESQQELLEQMKKTPFARHEDDEGLERMRRERVRAFDPINSKVFQENVVAKGPSTKKKKRKNDKKTSKARPKYAGPPAPSNRFGIQPGYRWDGVVRGTNWEEKRMMRQNANAAVSEEAYKFAVADM